MGPVDRVLTTSTAQYIARSLHVAAELGLAEALSDGPMPIETAAARVGADPDALARIVRLLASQDIFTYGPDGIGNNEASTLLRGDTRPSLKSFVSMFAQDANWLSCHRLADTVRTGEAALPKVFDGGLWAYYSERPDEGRVFDAAMEDRVANVIPELVAAYDFSRFKVIADIAGGRGHLLRAILAEHPRVRGVVFDLPQVASAAAALADASDRLSFRSGSFFDDPLPEADAYVLMDILHDWDDASSLRILKSIRQAATAGAKLLIVEGLVDESGDLHDFAKVIDVVMMTNFGGRQRSVRELGALAAEAGFAAPRVTHTPSRFSLVELTAV